MHKIYGLCDHEGRLRYIGRTKGRPRSRAREHWLAARYPRSTINMLMRTWLTSLTVPPQVILLDETDDYRLACRLEAAYIGLYRALGCKILNRPG
jgi:hypothetical protein